MEVICDKCNSKFVISDDKIPPGKTASLVCRTCKNKIKVGPPQISEDFGFDISDSDEKQPSLDQSRDNTGDEEFDAVDKPFDFAEEEGKTALICESNSEIQKKIVSVLELLEYHITYVDNTRNAIKKIWYHDYDIIVVNEEFDTKHSDTNGVMIYLERLEMITRRNIYVVLLSRRYRTMDYMMTLYRSANLIVNIKDIGDFDKILGRGLSDYNMFYRIYKESQKNVGIV